MLYATDNHATISPSRMREGDISHSKKRENIILCSLFLLYMGFGIAHFAFDRSDAMLLF